jgi:hypothetical protein
MLAGSQSKTMNHKVNAFWPTVGDRRDFAMYGRVGTWIGQNAKVLDKQPVTECAKLVAEQFPELTLVEVSDHTGRMARWSK